MVYCVHSLGAVEPAWIRLAEDMEVLFINMGALAVYLQLTPINSSFKSLDKPLMTASRRSALLRSG